MRRGYPRGAGPRQSSPRMMTYRFLHALTGEIAKVLIIMVILLSLAYLRDVTF